MNADKLSEFIGKLLEDSFTLEGCKVTHWLVGAIELQTADGRLYRIEVTETTPPDAERQTIDA